MFLHITLLHQFLNTETYLTWYFYKDVIHQNLRPIFKSFSFVDVRTNLRKDGSGVNCIKIYLNRYFLSKISLFKEQKRTISVSEQTSASVNNLIVPPERNRRIGALFRRGIVSGIYAECMAQAPQVINFLIINERRREQCTKGSLNSRREVTFHR